VLKEYYIDIKLYKIKDNIKQSRIELHYILSVDQPVDSLIKALLKDIYEVFKIGISVIKVS
jgi:hypothetical protein